MDEYEKLSIVETSINTLHADVRQVVRMIKMDTGRVGEVFGISW